MMDETVVMVDDHPIRRIVVKDDEIVLIKY